MAIPKKLSKYKKKSISVRACYDSINIVFTPFAVTVSPPGVDRTNRNESYIYDTFFVGSVASILLLVKGYELFC